jgi:hypothetical protein
MLKLLFAVLGLIVLAMVAGAYLNFNPAWLIFAILGFGIFMVGKIGGPSMPPGGKYTHWGGGHGIYFDSKDPGVTGSDSEDPGRNRDGSPR